jgi:NAD(P)-dependent dehydrogenase (short-subunit alcohol dehydrogenase family)
MSKLANKTALVTGASRGMGGAATLVLAAAGARDRAFTATAWPELTHADGAGLSRAPGPCPWMSITVSVRRGSSAGRRRQTAGELRPPTARRSAARPGSIPGRLHLLQ